MSPPEVESLPFPRKSRIILSRHNAAETAAAIPMHIPINVSLNEAEPLEEPGN